jgi:hypothetical protein
MQEIARYYEVDCRVMMENDSISSNLALMTARSVHGIFASDDA